MQAEAHAETGMTPPTSGWRSFADIAAVMGIWKRGLLLSAVVLNILGLALPLAMLQLFDRIIPRAAVETLAMIVIGLLAALLCEAALRIARSIIIAWNGARFDHKTSTHLVACLLDAPLRAVEAQPIGVHMTRMNSVEPVRDFYSQQLAFLFADGIFIIIFMALMYYIAGWLVLVPLAMVAIYGALAWVTGDALHRALVSRKEFDDRRYNFIFEVLSSIHSAKALAMEQALQRRYERLIAGCATPAWRVNYLSSLAESYSASFSLATSIAVGAAGAWFVINDQMSVGALAAVTMLSGRSVQPLLRALGLWHRFQSVRINVQNLEKVVAMPRENAAAAIALDHFQSATVADVHFAYEGAAAPVFEGAALSIQRGETISISGANGSGKTTLIRLLAGDLAAGVGEIRVNDRPIDDLDHQSLRRRIAVIPQHCMLLQGTVLDNLTRFDVDANLDQALELAARLGLDRFFAALADGYEMQVGDGRSHILPSGVIQRIGMVRALVGQPELILFDEANMSLDQHGDKLVRELLASYKQDCGIVIVSFRPSLLAIADRHFEIRERRIQPAAGVPAGGRG